MLSTWVEYSTEDFVDSWDSATGELVVYTADFATYSAVPDVRIDTRVTATSTETANANH